MLSFSVNSPTHLSSWDLMIVILLSSSDKITRHLFEQVPLLFIAWASIISQHGSKQLDHCIPRSCCQLLRITYPHLFHYWSLVPSITWSISLYDEHKYSNRALRILSVDAVAFLQDSSKASSLIERFNTASFVNFSSSSPTCHSKSFTVLIFSQEKDPLRLTEDNFCFQVESPPTSTVVVPSMCTR